MKAFALSLASYVKLLQGTTTQLLVVSDKLIKKTQDPNVYAIEEYISDIQKYQSSIDVYTSAAEKLNPLYEKAFGR